MAQSSHSVEMSGALIQTTRLCLAPWTMSDVERALNIFGDNEVARWLAPAMDRVPDLVAMRNLVSGWIADNSDLEPPLGRWKVTESATGHIVGADEVFAVSRPANLRAAAASRRMGMDWVGQTSKYYSTRLDVFRLRRYDLDVPAVATRPETGQADELTGI